MNERNVPDYVEKALFEWSDGALTENARDAAILRFVSEAVVEERGACLACVVKFKGDLPCAEIMATESAIRARSQP